MRTLSDLQKWSQILTKVPPRVFVATLVFLSEFKHVFHASSTRKHNERRAGGSSPGGKTGHPGHEGKAGILPPTRRQTLTDANANSCFHRPSRRCRDRLKASARSSTPNPVRPHWRSTRKCSDTTANQMLSCCRRGGASSADGPSEEL